MERLFRREDGVALLPWLIGEEEHIYYDYRRPIGELAVADYCATYQIPNPVVHGLRGGDVEEHHLNAWNNGIFEFQVNAFSVAEVEPYYRKLQVSPVFWKRNTRFW